MHVMNRAIERKPNETPPAQSDNIRALRIRNLGHEIRKSSLILHAERVLLTLIATGICAVHIWGFKIKQIKM